MFSVQTKAAAVAVVLVVLGVVGYLLYGRGYQSGYIAGHKDGEAAAVAAYCQAADKPSKPDTVTVQSGVATTAQVAVRPRTDKEKESPAVQVTTEPPTVAVAVNGQKYDFKPQTEILTTGIKTTAAINVKVPERKWSVGIGTDGKKPAFMLKAPIKGAVGAWVAGSTKNKIMGGITVSF